MRDLLEQLPAPMILLEDIDEKEETTEYTIAANDNRPNNCQPTIAPEYKQGKEYEIITSSLS